MEKFSYNQMTRDKLIAELGALNQRLKDLETVDAERQRAVDALRETEEKYRVLLDESSDPIFMFAPDGTYRYVNRAFANGVARNLDEIINRKIWDVFPKDEADKRFAAVKWVVENGETKVIEVRVPRTDGDRYYITTVKPVKDDAGRVLTVICISKEITERKRMEDELRRLSTYDFLTNLYNRHFFEAEVKRVQNSRLFPISIVMMDLDGLKMVNDRMGHIAGDALIIKAAQVLRDSFRSEDIIARFGGDEFIVLLPETGEHQTRVIIARLRANIEKMQDPFFSLSIGSATGQKGSSLEEIIRLADDEMYREKGLHQRRQLDPGV
jgi:diguanylate cyclase (GGDEF)-like protein/PAS domain S-box-containing protein